MSSAEEDSFLLPTDTKPTKDDKQLGFMKIIKCFPILLNKSQVPSVKSKKDGAYTDTIKKLQQVLGEIYTKDQLSAKISRMKNDVKIKIDKTRTGNKKIDLREWEKIMCELIEADTNPSVAQVPGAIEIGPKTHKKQCSTPSEATAHSSKDPQYLPAPPTSTRHNKRKNSGEYIDSDFETDETKMLSTNQLQRLVLLEQLNLLRMKRQRLEVQPSISYVSIVDGEV